MHVSVCVAQCLQLSTLLLDFLVLFQIIIVWQVFQCNIHISLSVIQYQLRLIVMFHNVKADVSLLILPFLQLPIGFYNLYINLLLSVLQLFSCFKYCINYNSKQRKRIHQILDKVTLLFISLSHKLTSLSD